MSKKSKQAINDLYDLCNTVNDGIRESLEIAIRALEVVDGSRHLCLTCEKRRAGNCETEDVTRCRNYTYEDGGEYGLQLDGTK